MHIFNVTETFQHTHFSSFHTPGVAKSFINEEALRLLKTGPLLHVGRGKKDFAGFLETNSRKSVDLAGILLDFSEQISLKNRRQKPADFEGVVESVG